MQEPLPLDNGSELTPKPVRRPVSYRDTYHDESSRHDCSCGCHGSQHLSTQRSSYQLFAGTLRLSYFRNTTSKHLKCCGCNYSGPRLQYRVDFRCPLPLWRGVAQGSISFDTSTGVLSTWLRPTAIIPASDWVWRYGLYGHSDQFIQRADVLGVSLSDTNEDGFSILEVSTLSSLKTIY